MDWHEITVGRVPSRPIGAALRPPIVPQPEAVYHSLVSRAERNYLRSGSEKRSGEPAKESVGLPGGQPSCRWAASLLFDQIETLPIQLRIAWVSA